MPADAQVSVIEALPLVVARERFDQDGVAVIGGMVDADAVEACRTNFGGHDPALPGQRVFALDRATMDFIGPGGALGQIARELMGAAGATGPYPPVFGYATLPLPAPLRWALPAGAV